MLSVAGEARATDCTPTFDPSTLATCVQCSRAFVVISQDRSSRAQAAVAALVGALRKTGTAWDVALVEVTGTVDLIEDTALMAAAHVVPTDGVLITQYFDAERAADESLLVVIREGSGSFRAAFLARAGEPLPACPPAESAPDEELPRTRDARRAPVDPDRDDERWNA